MDVVYRRFGFWRRTFGHQWRHPLDCDRAGAESAGLGHPRRTAGLDAHPQRAAELVDMGFYLYLFIDPAKVWVELKYSKRVPLVFLHLLGLMLLATVPEALRLAEASGSRSFR